MKSVQQKSLGYNHAIRLFWHIRHGLSVHILSESDKMSITECIITETDFT